MQELTGWIDLRNAMTEPCNKGGGESRAFTLCERQRRAQNSRYSTCSGTPPLVDKFFCGRQLSSEDKLDVGPENCVFGQRLRIVRCSAVDQR